MTRLTYRLTTKEGKGAGSSVFTIRSLHGHSSGRKKGGQINSLNDMVANWDADIFLRGHSHRLITDQLARIRTSQTGPLKLIQDTVVFGSTGCFYKTYQEDTDCYAEIADYPPSELGCVVVRVVPFKRDRVDGVRTRTSTLSAHPFVV
jgi:hypothetical protein